jgi:4-hydroxy-tetrahydrodipicolinate synthase
VANVLPNSHARLYELAVQRKDPAAARKLFYRMLPVLELMEGGGKYTQFVKAACGLVGHRVGPPRRPLMPATAEDKARLRRALRELGEDR